jgi:hypothetical protein
VTDKPQDKERAERDQERSDEAHWKVAEEGAEDETQTTEKGLQIPVPKRGEFFSNLKKVSKPKR